MREAVATWRKGAGVSRIFARARLVMKEMVSSRQRPPTSIRKTTRRHVKEFRASPFFSLLHWKFDRCTDVGYEGWNEVNLLETSSVSAVPSYSATLCASSTTALTRHKLGRYGCSGS